MAGTAVIGAVVHLLATAIEEGRDMPPFWDCPFDQRDDEGVDDLVDRLAGLHCPAEVGAGLLIGGGTGPVTVPGGVDGGHREVLRIRQCN